MDNETFRKFNMYIHSTFRNVGLFTSLAYGSLAYSRIYRGHNAIMIFYLSLLAWHSLS